MALLLASQHRDFFTTTGYIEFEELLSIKEITALRECIDQVNVTRDLFRQDSMLKKKILSCSSFACTLFQKPTLRLLYDQLIQTTKTPEAPFDQPHSLEEISCFQKVAGGLILSLADFKGEALSSPYFLPIPKRAGDAIFVRGNLRLSLPQLFTQPHQDLLLIVYGFEKTRYVLQERDPRTHELKKEGYGFGDLLRIETHPLIRAIGGWT